MKKRIGILWIMIIAVSLCGCNTQRDRIGKVFGIAYMGDVQETPRITCAYVDEIEVQEYTVEDAAFYEALKDVIDGKRARNYFCDCMGDYQITIDDRYRLYLHPGSITVYTDLEDYTGFTIECSTEETKILYDILESYK